jgi:hypothetical protein
MLRSLGMAFGLLIAMRCSPPPVIVPPQAGSHAGAAGHSAGAPSAGSPSAGSPSAGSPAAGSAGAGAPAAGATAPPAAAKPLVTLLTDTSGSMIRLPGCQCTTFGCSECLPDCSQNQRNRWHELLATLTGSFVDFACSAQARTTANGSTYDVGYSMPFRDRLRGRLGSAFETRCARR